MPLSFWESGGVQDSGDHKLIASHEPSEELPLNSTQTREYLMDSNRIGHVNCVPVVSDTLPEESLLHTYSDKQEFKDRLVDCTGPCRGYAVSWFIPQQPPKREALQAPSMIAGGAVAAQLGFRHVVGDHEDDSGQLVPCGWVAVEGRRPVSLRAPRSPNFGTDFSAVVDMRFWQRSCWRWRWRRRWNRW